VYTVHCSVQITTKDIPVNENGDIFNMKKEMGLNLNTIIRSENWYRGIVLNLIGHPVSRLIAQNRLFQVLATKII